jgi:hypothetical protein
MGTTYSEQVLVNKSITINGKQKDVNAINNDGSIRNLSESIVQGNSSSSGICFTITVNNVTINGFKCILPATNLVRDAFNLKVTPTGSNYTATLENIIIKNNIVQNLRNNTGQCQAILFGESTTNVNNASNGDGIWNNIEITNNYFDCSTSLNGYRGIQFSTHFYTVTFSNINIHNNKFVHSSNITSNRAIGVTSNISVTGKGPSYLNSFKIKNNIFNTPSNTGIGGFFDCDGNCEISNNTFNSKYGISSMNSREVGLKIQNNTFNVTEYSIAINDNWYATTNGYDMTISGNNFNGNPTKHFECSSSELNIDNLRANNTFGNGNVLKSAETTYRQFDNLSNPLLTRTTKSIYSTIQKAIDAIGTEILNVSKGTYSYTSSLQINKEITIEGSGYGTIISFTHTTTTGIQITSNNVTLSNMFVKIGPINGARCIVIGGSLTGNTIDNVKLKNLKISSENSSTASYGLYLQSSPNSTLGSNKLSNIEVDTCEIIYAVNGIKVSDFTQVNTFKILNTKIYNNSDYGLHFTTPGAFVNTNDFNPEVKMLLSIIVNFIIMVQMHQVQMVIIQVGQFMLKNSEIQL